MSGPSTSVPRPVAAAITPRNRHEEIDFGAGFELIDFLCGAGVRGIALFTATGEYASLAADERTRFLCLARKRSRAPILAGIGAATLDGALGMAREARDAGASALLLPPPHGCAYDEDDIREFYLQFAAHAGGGPPVYIVDSRGLCSGVAPAIASELVAAGAVAGVADFVSETAGVVPELAVALQHATAAGRTDEAARIAAMLREFEDWMREFPAPVGLKTALALRRVKTGPLPVPLSPRKQARLDEFRAWFSVWLPAAKNLYAHA